MFARYREGVVSETKRISHVLRLPDDLLALPADGSGLAELESLCGLRFPPGVLEQMPAWAGMPCIACTVQMPTGKAIER